MYLSTKKHVAYKHVFFCTLSYNPSLALSVIELDTRAPGGLGPASITDPDALCASQNLRRFLVPQNHHKK